MLQKITSLSAVYQKAAAAAVAVSKNAYAPYSEFHVGACFVHKDGSLTPGCNYENCTFQGTCAERCCMVSANAQGKRTAVAVAVWGTSSRADVKIPADTLTPPCGLCRQHLYEVQELSQCELDLILVAQDEKRARVMKLGELLPLPFGPSAFGVDLAKYRPAAEDKKATAAATAAAVSAANVVSSPANKKNNAKAAPAEKKSNTIIIVDHFIFVFFFPKSD